MEHDLTPEIWSRFVQHAYLPDGGEIRLEIVTPGGMLAKVEGAQD